MPNVAIPDLVGQELSACIPSGGPIEAYMQWAVPQYGAPPLYHLAVALTCATHELARRGFWLDGGAAPMLLWSALVGKAGNGKSGAIGMGKQFLQDLWLESSNPPATDPWVYVEGSISGLFVSLQDFYDASRGTTVAILQDEELSGTLASRETITEFLCKLYDGCTQQRHLREFQKISHGRPRLDRLLEPRVSALMASTDEALASVFTPAMRNGGLFSRIWWIAPDPIPARPIIPHMVEPYTAAIDTWLGWLVQLSMFETKALSVGPAATALWTEEFYGALNQSAADHSEGDNAGVRLRSLERARLMAVVLASLAGRSVAEPVDMQVALELHRLAMVGASRMYLLGTSPEIRDADKLLKGIQLAGEAGINRRGLYQGLRMSKRNLDAAIEHLVDAQEIVEDRSQGRVRYFATATTRGAEIAARTPVAGQIVRLGKKKSDDDGDDGSGKPN